MIKYIKGDIFKSNAQIIVNPVNCVGAQGAGLALEFKNRFPDVYMKYKLICKKQLLTPGKLLIIDNILHFPTKVHWKDNSTLEYIESGLIKFRNTYKDKNIHSIAFPKLGCGKGSLDWKEVKLLMDKYLELDIPVEIYI